MELSELIALVKAIAAKLGVAPLTSLPVVASLWWWPTPEETAAFAKRIGWTAFDLEGNRQSNGSAASPTIKPCDGSEEDAKTFAKFGFLPTGIRWLWSPEDRNAGRKLSDRIFKAPRPEDANEIISGAGDPGVTTDGAVYMIMTGCTTGGGLLGTPRVGLGGALTIADAVAVFMRQTTPGPGPGPSGRP